MFNARVPRLGLSVVLRTLANKSYEDPGFFFAQKFIPEKTAQADDLYGFTCYASAAQAVPVAAAALAVTECRFVLEGEETIVGVLVCETSASIDQKAALVKIASQRMKGLAKSEGPLGGHN